MVLGIGALLALAILRLRPSKGLTWGRSSAPAFDVRKLLASEIAVVEVNRPYPHARQRLGKSDPIDAELAARAVVSGTATAVAKDTRGIVEAIRQLIVTRSGALKARTSLSAASLDGSAPSTTRSTSLIANSSSSCRQRHHARSASSLSAPKARASCLSPPDRTSAASAAGGVRRRSAAPPRSKQAPDGPPVTGSTSVATARPTRPYT
jgi:hypothetical protein